MELWYSQLAEIVSNGKGPGLEQLTSGIDEALAERMSGGKKEGHLASYFRDQALLQRSRRPCKRPAAARSPSRTRSLSHRSGPPQLPASIGLALRSGWWQNRTWSQVFSEDNGGDEGAISSLQAAVVDVSLEVNVPALEPGSMEWLGPQAGGGSVALSDPVRIEVRLEELLQNTSGASLLPLLKRTPRHASWRAGAVAAHVLDRLAHRKHPEVKFA